MRQRDNLVGKFSIVWLFENILYTLIEGLALLRKVLYIILYIIVKLCSHDTLI